MFQNINVLFASANVQTLAHNVSEEVSEIFLEHSSFRQIK